MLSGRGLPAVFALLLLLATPAHGKGASGGRSAGGTTSSGSRSTGTTSGGTSGGSTSGGSYLGRGYSVTSGGSPYTGSYAYRGAAIGAVGFIGYRTMSVHYTDTRYTEVCNVTNVGPPGPPEPPQPPPGTLAPPDPTPSIPSTPPPEPPAVANASLALASTSVYTSFDNMNDTLYNSSGYYVTDCKLTYSAAQLSCTTSVVGVVLTALATLVMQQLL